MTEADFSEAQGAEPQEMPNRAEQGRQGQEHDDAMWHELLAERDELLAALKTREPLREDHARMMALLMDEATTNLAALMEASISDELGVRHFLPDELNGCAIMLRDAYGIGAKP